MMLSGCEQYLEACVPSDNVYPFNKDPGCDLPESTKVVKETCLGEVNPDNDDDNDEDDDDEEKKNSED
jgi:hypothetical protein